MVTEVGDYTYTYYIAHTLAHMYSYCSCIHIIYHVKKRISHGICLMMHHIHAQGYVITCVI